MVMVKVFIFGTGRDGLEKKDKSSKGGRGQKRRPPREAGQKAGSEMAGRKSSIGTASWTKRLLPALVVRL